MSIKLQDLLPEPSNIADDFIARDPWFRSHDNEKAVVSAVREPPPYGHRSGFQPRSEQDFGDGGAFPEILLAQFPLGMGRSSKRQGSTNTLALQLDGEGKVQYDAIARVGHAKNKVIYTKLSDTKQQYIDEDDERVQKPDEEEVNAITEKTRAALEKITQTKVAAALPVRHAEKVAPAQHIRYTPSQQGAGFAGGAEQRIIRMVEEQRDPMEPPRFKINAKLPRAPPSPPAPVMHSPTRKVTAKEQADWKVPPCLSNWKNPKGFTIALDKRLAADGRGLQQVHINENFAKLSEALYIADRKARESVEMRTQLEKRVAQKKKEEQEEQMREMARQAREQRQGIRHNKGEGAADEQGGDDEEVAQRDEIRRERQLDRRRDRNIARAAPEKMAKIRREKDRDVSEKIALGLADPRARGDNSGATQFDERLFNQSKGLDAGGGHDDETYAVYDKPWRAQDNIAKNIYRPSKNADTDIYGADLDKIINTNRFVPDRGFSGTDTGGAAGAPTKRDGPVQFERSEEDDPFGLGQLFENVKKGKRKQDEPQASSSSTANESTEKRQRR
jgi:SNW domain-containing protein 1